MVSYQSERNWQQQQLSYRVVSNVKESRVPPSARVSWSGFSWSSSYTESLTSPSTMQSNRCSGVEHVTSQILGNEKIFVGVTCSQSSKDLKRLWQQRWASPTLVLCSKHDLRLTFINLWRKRLPLLKIKCM